MNVNCGVGRGGREALGKRQVRFYTHTAQLSKGHLNRLLSPGCTTYSWSVAPQDRNLDLCDGNEATISEEPQF